MKVATSLILKLSGGMAAVGGAGGVIMLHKNGYFSGRSKEDPRNQNDTSQNKALAQQGMDNVPNDASGSQQNPPNPIGQVPSPSDLKLIEQDDLGLPAHCETVGECDLDTEDKIKKVKFHALGDGKDPVTVTPPLSEGEKISVTIEGDENNKRYIFNNESNEITLKKGASTSSVSLQLPQGKTRFIEEGKKLKKLELGNYGLPKICETQKSCKLTSSDLETIKFSDFEDGEFSPFITVDGLDSKKTISLSIEDNKYIFDSPSSVDIKRNGTTTVELGIGDTEFKVDNEKLKKVVLGDFGLPEECEFQESKNSTTCSLSPRDLKKIKFNVFGNSPTVSGLNNNEKITLKIQKVEDSSFPNGREYIFTPSNDVTITYSSEPSQTITLSKGDNTFKKERGGDTLVALPKREYPTQEVKDLDEKIKDLGLPKACTFTNKASGNNKSFECELSHEELKKLKFSGGDVQSISEGQVEGREHVGDPKVYKLKIEEPKDNERDYGTKNIRVTFLSEEQSSWSQNLVISSGSGESIVIANKTDTEFKINDQSNKLEKVWGETTLSEEVGLKCPKDTSNTQANCTLKDNNGSIKLFIDNQDKDFKPTNKEDLENNMEYGDNQSDYNQGLKFTVKTSISGTNGTEGEELTLAAGTYQIKRIPDKGWRFTNK